MWTALARVRMTTLLSSLELGVSVPGQECIIKREGEEKTYRVEDFCAPPGGVVFGGEISELPSPVISLEIKLSKLAIS